MSSTSTTRPRKASTPPRALIEGALEEAGVDRMRVIGAAASASPAPIDRETGIVGSSAILPGWVGVRAVEELRRRLDVPVLVDNDANLGALAEAAYGAGRGAEDFVYVMLSSGIGAGLILHGRLCGSAGLAGELGHVLVDPDGPVCRCGNRGCLETAAAGPRAGRAAAPPATATGSRWREMLRLALAGDHGCARVIADAGRAVGFRGGPALQRASTPSLLVVGGELALAGELLLHGVQLDRPLGAAGRRGGAGDRARRAGGARRGPRRRRARGLRVRSALDAARRRGGRAMNRPTPQTTRRSPCPTR